jgi:hypothetical protein
MKRTSPHAIGLVFATLLAMWHVIWAFLVWAGAAQPFLDFIFRIHMITPPYMVSAFSLSASATLVLVTAAIGYVGGWMAGFAWNRCSPRESST